MLFFLRTADRETEIRPGTAAIRLETPPSDPIRMAARGAVDRALETGLFQAPFDRGWYRGYVAAREQMISVGFAPPPPLSDPEPAETTAILDTPARPESRPADQRDWATGSLGMAYVGAQSLVASTPEYGGQVRLSLPVARNVVFQATIEGSYARQGEWKQGRLAGAPGISYRITSSPVWLEGGVDLGMGAFLVSGVKTGLDPTVPWGRARLGMGMEWVDRWVLELGGGASGHLITLDGKEQVKTRPELSAGIAWRL